MEPKLLTADRFVDIRTGCSYRYVHSYTEYFRPHFHDYYEIFIPMGGEAKHVVNGESALLKRGRAVFIRPSDVHDYVCEDGSSFEMLNITFTKETADEIFAFLGEGFKKEALLSPKLPPAVELGDSGMKSLTLKMAEITAIGNNDTEKLKTALKVLILTLFSEHFSRFRDTKNSDVPLWLSDLRKAMRKDGNFAAGADVMPSICGKSREHIARSMKKYYGVTVSEFVNSLRLNYIANMLVHSDKKLLDIVFESGFNNLSWANDCFYKKFGCSMSAFRKNKPKGSSEMKTYLESFFHEFDYPQEARDTLNEAYEKIYANAKTAAIFDGILENYDKVHAIKISDMKDGLNLAAELTGVHEYTVKLLIHICLSKTLRALYAERGLDDSLWFGAMSDLKWKLIESHLVKGVWGTFVADWNWFSRWYDLTRFAFGRLQFETIPFNREYEKDGIRLTKESKVINIHIPRTGTPLDHGEILKSYQMAKEFYADEFKDSPMPFFCSSWLLFPEHEKFLHEKSNIRKFMSDFDIFSGNYYPEENKSAIWRVFDCPETTPLSDMPEDSFLKRAYKEYLKNGGKPGYGSGIFFA